MIDWFFFFFSFSFLYFSGRNVSSPDSDDELDAKLCFSALKVIGIYEMRLNQTEDRRNFPTNFSKSCWFSD